MIRGIAAAASIKTAEAAAVASLEAGAGAADAVIAGFFAAAGADARVLLSPAVALVAGTGAGARAFDGRAAQPGRGAARPRGFVSETEIAPAAYVAAPRALALISLMHGLRGRASLREAAKAGVSAAKEAGAERRAELLRRAGDVGLLALRSPAALEALLAAGGPIVGGALTEEDVTAAEPADVDATITRIAGFTAVTPPWPAGEATTRAEIVIACDARGLLAAIVFAPSDGVAIPALELVAPAVAVPVRRGVTRVSPGTALPMRAPVAIVQRAGFSAVVAAPGAASIAPESLAALVSGDAVATALAAIGTEQGAAFAVVTDGKTAQAILASR